MYFTHKYSVIFQLLTFVFSNTKKFPNVLSIYSRMKELFSDVRDRNNLSFNHKKMIFQSIIIVFNIQCRIYTDLIAYDTSCFAVYLKIAMVFVY